MGKVLVDPAVPGTGSGLAVVFKQWLETAVVGEAVTGP
jgi:hypothetical protein